MTTNPLHHKTCSPGAGAEHTSDTWVRFNVVPAVGGDEGSGCHDR
jgi:hypothetical protein